MKKKKSSKPTKAKRIRILWDNCWEQMSLFTRLKWANTKGFVRCVTCGNVKHYKNMNAGHFIHNHMDFEEENINPQCVRCNKWLHGNLIQYTTFLLLKYGADKVKDLQERGKVKQKYTEEELTKLLPELTAKVVKAQNGEYNCI